MNFPFNDNPWHSLNLQSLKPLLKNASGFAFDLDGTLADNEGQALDLIRDIISKHIVSLTEGEFEGLKSCYRHMAGHKLDDIIETAEIESEVLLTEDTRKAIKKDIAARRISILKETTQCDPIRPLAALAHFIKQEGVPICIVTASEQHRAEHFVRITGLDEIFTGNPKDWLFASNLKPKTDAHKVAQQRMSEIYDRRIDPLRWVGFEDSPSAVAQAIKAGAVVIPHTLCTHISEEHQPRRVMALQAAKLQELHTYTKKTKITEFIQAGQGILRPIQQPKDVLVIRSVDDIVPVVSATLNAIPLRVRLNGLTPA